MLQAKRGEATVGLLCDFELYCRQQTPTCGWAETVVQPVPNTYAARQELQQKYLVIARGFTQAADCIFQVQDMKAHLHARCLSTTGTKPALAARVGAAEAADLMMKEGLIRLEAARARRFPLPAAEDPPRSRFISLAEGDELQAAHAQPPQIAAKRAAATTAAKPTAKTKRKRAAPKNGRQAGARRRAGSTGGGRRADWAALPSQIMEYIFKLALTANTGYPVVAASDGLIYGLRASQGDMPTMLEPHFPRRSAAEEDQYARLVADGADASGFRARLQRARDGIRWQLEQQERLEEAVRDADAETCVKDPEGHSGQVVWMASGVWLLQNGAWSGNSAKAAIEAGQKMLTAKDRAKFKAAHAIYSKAARAAAAGKLQRRCVSGDLKVAARAMQCCKAWYNAVAMSAHLLAHCVAFPSRTMVTVETLAKVPAAARACLNTLSM
jgi:hypothetical protein